MGLQEEASDAYNISHVFTRRGWGLNMRFSTIAIQLKLNADDESKVWEYMYNLSTLNWYINQLQYTKPQSLSFIVNDIIYLQL